MANLLLLGGALLLGPTVLGNAHAMASNEDPRPQAQAPDWSRYRYDVVSIKLLKGQGTLMYSGLVADLSPGGISVRKATLIDLLQSAYAEIDRSSSGFGLRVEQITGYPNWAYTALYTIEGKLGPSMANQLGKLSPLAQTLARAHMLQAMLADRFKLKVHAENREGRVYYLGIAKGGPKMKQATPGEVYPQYTFGGQVLSNEPGLVVMPRPEPGSTKRVGLGAPTERLVQNLSSWLHCPVIDKTGLTGKYDFELQWTAKEDAETGPAANWPSLFTAIQKQLGLKLEPGKGPVPFLVIDHAEMASEN